MDITEVRIKLMEDPGERLQAFCSITFDDAFVVRDLKIIDGTKGPFVAMPSRKLTDHCPKCGCKNHLRANYCNQCGTRLGEDRAAKDADGRAKLHADIAHPINSACRELIQQHVLRAFQEEQERAKQPGYVSSYDDYDVDDDSYSPPAGKGEPGADDLESETAGYRDAIKRLEAEDESRRAPHHLRRGSQPSQAQSAEKEDREDFGAGIL